MKCFFDTSVLIPVFLEDHVHHERSLAAFLRAGPGDACCAAHSLAELYATITRLPGAHRLSGEQALLFVQEICNRLAQISLDADEYLATIEECSASKIVGGAVYDALLARCAMGAGTEIIYTWNVRHFERFGPEIRGRLQTP